jgi:hypothetical protein
MTAVEWLTSPPIRRVLERWRQEEKREQERESQKTEAAEDRDRFCRECFDRR